MDIDAIPDPPSLSLSFARGRAKVQAWGRGVDNRYFPILTVNPLVNKWGIHKVPCIIYLTLTNSTSFGSFRCITGRSSHSIQKNIIWSMRESSHKRAWEWMGNNIIMKYLKCPHGPRHWKKLVETIKMDFWFTQFGVRTQKLWPLQDSQCWKQERWSVKRPEFRDAEIQAFCFSR